VGSVTSFVAFVMAVACLVGYRWKKKQARQQRKQPVSSILRESLLREEFREEGEYNFLDSGEQQRQALERGGALETVASKHELRAVAGEEAVPLLYYKSVRWPTLALFWVLMLGHTGCMVYGLLAYWDRVNVKGVATQASDGSDDIQTLSTFNVQVYIATFWINVKQFWESEAYTMAYLIFFAGVVQPIIQLTAVTTIAFAPLTRTFRQRMLTVQEVTAKVPLAAFFVEAYLLVVFAFDLDWVRVFDVPSLKSIARPEYTLEASGSVDVVSYVGLLLFMLGQLSFLAVLNLLRLTHRSQAPAAAAQEGVLLSLAAQDGQSVSRESDSSGAFFLGSGGPVENPSSSPDGGGGGGDNDSLDDTPRATLELHVEYGPYGPARSRPVWRRVLAAFLAFALAALVALLCTKPFVRFKFSGVVKPYIILQGQHQDDGDASNDDGGGDNDDDDDDGVGALSFALGLVDTLTRIRTSMKPKSFALFYTAVGLTVLAANPLLLSLLALADACLPDRLVAARRKVGEAVELLQCWCAGEAIVVATFFLVPNIELITLFVFDASDACDDIDGYTGKECLVVSGEFENASSVVTLVAYAVVAILLSRLCVGELHGHWGGELLVEEHLSERHTSTSSALFR